MWSIYRNPQLKIPYVTLRDVTAPLPNTELGVGCGDCSRAKQNKNHGENAVCSFVICYRYKYLNTFFLSKIYSILCVDSKDLIKLELGHFWPSYGLFCDKWFYDFSQILGNSSSSYWDILKLSIAIESFALSLFASI